MLVIKYLIFISFFILPVTAHADCLSQYPNWERIDKPVFRDKLPAGNYEVASDPHVFLDQSGGLKMIYSGDDEDHISIKMAQGSSWHDWSAVGSLIGPSKGHKNVKSKETPFYFLNSKGEHQIYFIGYKNEKTYKSQIYLATAKNVEGPYEVMPEPIIKRGKMDGKKVHTITSPSVIEHVGLLWMTFLAWDDFPDVRKVWVMGSISKDQGQTWSDPEEVNVPIGMEGQITKAPDGRFWAVRTGEYKDSEAIFLSCADHPWGPYKSQSKPILERGGAPWEVNENQAPQITFDPASGVPVLYYVGADYSKGWWVMMARPQSSY